MAYIPAAFLENTSPFAAIIIILMLFGIVAGLLYWRRKYVTLALTLLLFVFVEWHLVSFYWLEAADSYARASHALSVLLLFLTAIVLVPISLAIGGGVRGIRALFSREETQEVQTRAQPSTIPAAPANRGIEKSGVNKRWMITLALALVLGSVGAHRFYNGKMVTGSVMLILFAYPYIFTKLDPSAALLVALILPLTKLVLYGLIVVDLVQIARNKFTDKNGITISFRNAGFIAA